MKRVHVLFFTFLLCFALCSCGEKDKASDMTENVSSSEQLSESASSTVIVYPSVQQPAAADISSSEVPSEAENEAATETSEVDVDLTDMSSTMVYSEVYNMVVNDPDSYMGKTIKMQGMLATYDANPDPELNLGVDYFFAVVVEDATACCQQGLEFVWEGHDTPDDFPPDGTVITVTGVFDSYDVGGLPMYHIVASSVEVDS